MIPQPDHIYRTLKDPGTAAKTLSHKSNVGFQNKTPPKSTISTINADFKKF